MLFSYLRRVVWLPVVLLPVALTAYDSQVSGDPPVSHSNVSFFMLPIVATHFYFWQRKTNGAHTALLVQRL